MRIIKKYKNRIMYDTQTSKPVNLKQIVEMIRGNIAVRILDNNSGEDITRLTILQALLDMEKSGTGINLPEVLLLTLQQSRRDVRSALKKLLKNAQQDLSLKHKWAQKQAATLVATGRIESEEEDQLVEEIISNLDEFHEELISSIIERISSRLENISKMISNPTDSKNK